MPNIVADSFILGSPVDMVKIRDQARWQRSVKKICRKLLYRLENYNNSNFRQNGEALFLADLFQTWRGTARVVCDVGANVRHYSAQMLELAHQNQVALALHLFEPTASCYQELEARFAQEPAVHLNRFGLSDAHAEVPIFYDRQKSGMASLYRRNLSPLGIDLSHTETIELRRLDQYIEAQKLSHIDFLKFDIEGHELSALRGMGALLNSDFVDVIQFEYGGANLDSHTSLLSLFEILEAGGLALFRIMPNYLMPCRYEFHMDNFQYANYVAMAPKVVSSCL